MHTIVPGTRTATTKNKDAVDIKRGDVFAGTGLRVVRVFHIEDGDIIWIHIYTSMDGHRFRHPVKTFAGEVIPVQA